MGLRTLAPDAAAYHGYCVGDQRTRDMAYHQGTVWPWLMGPFVSAYVKVNGANAAARGHAGGFLKPFADHLHQYGLGSICEIADGNAPYAPRGCVAQAWSVGEVLRVLYEDVLNRAPQWPHHAARERVSA
jgi:glycogen debranching enzyme